MIKYVVPLSCMATLVSGTASATTFREQALLGIDAISCSEAAEALSDSGGAADFMELGTFVVQHIYENYDQWQPLTPEHSTMPAIFTALTEGMMAPIEETEMGSLTYHTVEFFKGSLSSRVAREGEGMDAGQLFSLERDVARVAWADWRCAAIREQFL